MGRPARQHQGSQSQGRSSTLEDGPLRPLILRAINLWQLLTSSSPQLAVKLTELSMTSETTRLYDEAGAARRLSVSRRTIQRMRAEGWGPSYVRVGQRKIAYSEQALTEYANSRTHKSRAAELACA